MEPKPSANKDKHSTQEDVNQAETSGEAVVEAEEQGATFNLSPFSIKPEPKPNNE